jgi:hypothetical protein
MKKRRIFLHLAVLIGMLTPWAATAQFGMSMVSDAYGPAEPGDWFHFTAQIRSPASGQTVLFSVSPDNGTARAGVDYEAASGTLDFDAGQSTAMFTVLIRRDEQDEPDETFGVRIVHPSTGALLAEATGTIADDDGATTGGRFRQSLWFRRGGRRPSVHRWFGDYRAGTVGSYGW